MIKIGVLDIQGGVEEHVNILKKIENIEVLKVKYPKDLNNIDGLIIPGGESTTISKLMKKYGFIEAIKNFSKNGKSIWGTCAGLILLSNKVDDKDGTLKLIDIDVSRNAFGSQINSFSCNKIVEKISSIPLELIFIRAPIIKNVGENVKVLIRLEDKIVAAKQNNILVTSFHPELTNQTLFHEYFINNFIKAKRS
ncbi:pyridoxal 5'-phosphate synthase glutaminase subunit PdxT [Oceanotoga teriensis]|nr:pyridoxal 5'-phosphate synthase glutaminase subunit PdxT [Oceanotoga teriensis]MDO7977522.1 pyridoxal 5'-phosphate synthase glutaminase subunit PdxT [Oceanotoga teriensis]